MSSFLGFGSCDPDDHCREPRSDEVIADAGIAPRQFLGDERVRDRVEEPSTTEALRDRGDDPDLVGLPEDVVRGPPVRLTGARRRAQDLRREIVQGWPAGPFVRRSVAGRKAGHTSDRRFLTPRSSLARLYGLVGDDSFSKCPCEVRALMRAAVLLFQLREKGGGPDCYLVSTDLTR